MLKSKKFALPDTLLKSKNYCNTKFARKKKSGFFVRSHEKSGLIVRSHELVSCH